MAYLPIRRCADARRILAGRMLELDELVDTPVLSRRMARLRAHQ